MSHNQSYNLCTVNSFQQKTMEFECRSALVYVCVCALETKVVISETLLPSKVGKVLCVMFIAVLVLVHCSEMVIAA